MKYFKIHKLIWFIIVLVYTVLEGSIIAIIWVVYLIWNLKRYPNIWRDTHCSHYYYYNEEIKKVEEGTEYEENFWETVKNRFYFFRKC